MFATICDAGRTLNQHCINITCLPGYECWKKHNPASTSQMLVYCWAGVADGGPTLNQNWFNASCLLETRSSYLGLLWLGQHRRRWPNNKPALGQRCLLCGLSFPVSGRRRRLILSMEQNMLCFSWAIKIKCLIRKKGNHWPVFNGWDFL